MKRFFGLTAFADILLVGSMMGCCLSARAKSPLSVVYPPPEHETVAEQIFFIGTAAPQETVYINQQPITKRSSSGHFAPSLPLKLGENIFVIRQGEQELELKITRLSSQPEIPQKLAFAADSLTPAVDLARLPNEPICLGVVAPLEAKVTAQISKSKILLMPQIESVELPANSAVLTDAAIPQSQQNAGYYRGCTSFNIPGNYGQPLFTLEKNQETVTKQGQGAIKILSPQDIKVVEVTADAGVARTGASTNYSRLTPLPQGTQARVTGKEGAWLRLDYGGWIKAAETKPVLGNIPPHSLIRGVVARQRPGKTEIVFPLQVPVPLSIEQRADSITLSLHNTTAQTDTIRLDRDPIIKRLDWQQISPTQIDYTFELHEPQQWGYDLRYQGSNLIFTLRHPPQTTSLTDGTVGESSHSSVEGEITAPSAFRGNLGTTRTKKLPFPSTKPLDNIEILLDPGHGGAEKGAKGPTGYPEKAVNLQIAQLIETELTKLGATVHLTRKSDRDVSLAERVAIIDRLQPDLALSIHYNALPDNGDAENTQGISTFWYHPQAHAPAMFLHQYLVDKLGRADAGIFWNNLALTRPHTAPSVLLELGFMINPEEFEWIINEQQQQRLAQTLAKGIEEWFLTFKSDQNQQDLGRYSSRSKD